MSMQHITSIQSNINQTLSVAGVLAGMNPGLKAKAETRSAVKNLTRQKEAYSKMRDTAVQSSPDLAMEYQSDLADVSKKLFEADPTEQNLQDYLTDYSYTEEASKARARAEATTLDPEAAAWERYEEEQYENEVNDYLSFYRSAGQSAQQALQVKQAEKRATRRNFLDYIKNEPVSFGKDYVGTVGTLPKNLQKAIAKDYTKSERKQIMNREDAQNGK